MTAQVEKEKSMRQQEIEKEKSMRQQEIEKEKAMRQQEIEKEKSMRQRMQQEMNEKLANLTKMVNQLGRENYRSKE